MDNNNHLTEEQIDSYFTGSISSAHQLMVSQHLSVCPGCNMKLEQLRSLDQLIRNEYQIPPLSVDLSAKLSEKLFAGRYVNQSFPDKALGWVIAAFCIAGLFYYLWVFFSLNHPVFIPVILLLVVLYVWLSIKEFSIVKSRYYLQHFIG